MGRRRPSSIGAAIVAVNRLFDSVDEELDLPEDRDEWDEDDYEEEREAIGRKLVGISGRMARLRNRLRNTARQRDHFRGASGYQRFRPGGAGGPARGRYARHCQSIRMPPGLQCNPYTGETEPIPGYQQALPSPQSALTSNVALQAAPGTQAVVIPLESGVFLVAEASSAVLASAGAEKVSKALQEAACGNLLSGTRGSKQHWTEKL